MANGSNTSEYNLAQKDFLKTGGRRDLEGKAVPFTEEYYFDMKTQPVQQIIKGRYAFKALPFDKWLQKVKDDWFFGSIDDDTAANVLFDTKGGQMTKSNARSMIQDWNVERLMDLPAAADPEAQYAQHQMENVPSSMFEATSDPTQSTFGKASDGIGYTYDRAGTAIDPTFWANTTGADFSNPKDPGVKAYFNQIAGSGSYADIMNDKAIAAGMTPDMYEKQMNQAAVERAAATHASKIAMDVSGVTDINQFKDFTDTDIGVIGTTTATQAPTKPPAKPPVATPPPPEDPPKDDTAGTPESPSSIPKVLKQLQDNLAKAQASGNQAAITKAQNTLNKFIEVQKLDAPAQPQGGGNQVGSNQVGSNQVGTVAKDVLQSVTNLNQLETLFNSDAGADLGSTEILPFLMDVIGMSQEDASQEYMRLLNVRDGRGIDTSYKDKVASGAAGGGQGGGGQNGGGQNGGGQGGGGQGGGQAMGGTISPGAYATYGENPYAAYTDWRRSLYGDAPMAERIRLEEAGMPSLGYDRALGGFLLGGISPYGTGIGEEADETLMAADPRTQVGEAQAFMDYLKGGQFGTQQDLRTGFGGLADYLGQVRTFQEGGRLPTDFENIKLSPYYQVYGADPDDKQYSRDILGSATAALGYAPGMGARTRRNLQKAYDILGQAQTQQQVFGSPTPSLAGVSAQPVGARFADWVSTAF